MSDEEQDIDDTLEDDDGELIDWQLPLCFMKKRHKEKIEGIHCLPQSWRMKERVCEVERPSCPLVDMLCGPSGLKSSRLHDIH